MALIRFNDGSKETVISAETGAELWAVLNGEIEGTDEQQRFCMRVDKLFLNWRNAPDSYVLARFGIIARMAMASWNVESHSSSDGKHASSGKKIRPQSGDNFGWDFARKWGLWENGQISALGRKYA